MIDHIFVSFNERERAKCEKKLLTRSLLRSDTTDHPIIRQPDIESLEISLHVIEHNESIKHYAKSHTGGVTENDVSRSSTTTMNFFASGEIDCEEIVRRTMESLQHMLIAETIHDSRRDYDAMIGFAAHDGVARMRNALIDSKNSFQRELSSSSY